MVTNTGGWYYLAIKNICIIKTSKHDGDFYCLNCLHLFRTKNTLESHKKVCENKNIFVVLERVY